MSTGAGASRMTSDRFWDIIGRTADEGDADLQLEALDRALRKLSQAELPAFRDAYLRAHREANHWDLWAAAFLINGGCSDDGFSYFRDWLISKGQDVYEAAVEDADSLADVLDEDTETEFEEFGYVADEVYEDRFDDEMPPSPVGPDGAPQGRPFDEDEDALADRFPRIARRMEELG